MSVLQLDQRLSVPGLRHANVDPLKRFEKPSVPELDPAYYGLTEADMEAVFNTGSLVGPEQMPLREILRALRETYCGSIGVEYMYITDAGAEALDPAAPRGDPRAAELLGRTSSASSSSALTAAETLEKYLHTRYVGQKRFSLEGGESLIPLLDDLLQRAGEQGIQEMVIGMAHRGRLNVLVNTMGKMPKDLFSEFEGKHADQLPAGRRQVPHGLLVGHHHAGRADAPDAGVQPVAPGDRQPGGGGLGARAPAPPHATARASRCCRC